MKLKDPIVNRITNRPKVLIIQILAGFTITFAGIVGAMRLTEIVSEREKSWPLNYMTIAGAAFVTTSVAESWASKQKSVYPLSVFSDRNKNIQMKTFLV